MWRGTECLLRFGKWLGGLRKRDCGLFDCGCRPDSWRRSRDLTRASLFGDITYRHALEGTPNCVGAKRLCEHSMCSQLGVVFSLELFFGDQKEFLVFFSCCGTPWSDWPACTGLAEFILFSVA